MKKKIKPVNQKEFIKQTKKIFPSVEFTMINGKEYFKPLPLSIYRKEFREAVKRKAKFTSVEAFWRDKLEIEKFH